MLIRGWELTGRRLLALPRFNTYIITNTIRRSVVSSRMYRIKHEVGFFPD